jgi:hypothetical protein
MAQYGYGIEDLRGILRDKIELASEAQLRAALKAIQELDTIQARPVSRKSGHLSLQ